MTNVNWVIPVTIEAEPPRRSRLTFDHNLDRFPIPRVRWTWDGPKYAAVTFELSEKWSDAVVGVTWELPSWLSTRIDAALQKVGR